MKILTLNFLTCARKSCKSSPASFPLHPSSAELESLDVDFNPLLLRNLLPRLEWDALRSVCSELGLAGLPDTKPEPEELLQPKDEAMTGVTEHEENEVTGEPSALAMVLHRVLMETGVKEGKLVCGNCEHEYEVKEGIANFLLPAHLV